MRRRTLTVGSVVCLLLIGVLLIGYGRDMWYSSLSYGGQNDRPRQWVAGVGLGLCELERRTWNEPPDFRDVRRFSIVRIPTVPIKGGTRFSMVWNQKSFEIRRNVMLTSLYVEDDITFPLWCLILPLMVPPMLLVRRWHKSRRAGHGFEVSASAAA